MTELTVQDSQTSTMSRRRWWSIAGAVILAWVVLAAANLGYFANARSGLIDQGDTWTRGDGVTFRVLSRSEGQTADRGFTQKQAMAGAVFVRYEIEVTNMPRKDEPHQTLAGYLLIDHQRRTWEPLMDVKELPWPDDSPYQPSQQFSLTFEVPDQAVDDLWGIVIPVDRAGTRRVLRLPQ